MSTIIHRFSMESSSFLILLLFSLLLLLLNVPHSHTAQPPQCHQEERNALLEFKATFYNNEACNPDYVADLKTWIVEEGENGDCCNWGSVECDARGHVIFLDLSKSCLSGSLNSSSSIFKLTHLQSLYLSLNDFRYSKIPSAISNLSRLEDLELSYSNFSGQIPSDILNLTDLSYLWLEDNHQLTLKNPSLRDLVQSLRKLEYLYLGNVEILSSVPDSLSRLTSLQQLLLIDCKLQGQVPPSVANLTKLEYLDLSYNQFTGEIFPRLLKLTKLEYVALSSNKFSGHIPRTISRLKNLKYLHLDSNDFSRKTHFNVFFQLDSLEDLNLSYNNFSFVIDSSIKPRSSFSNFLLTNLDLSSNNISREIPTWICDLDNLYSLNLSNNNLIGMIPQCLIGTDGPKSMTWVDLSHNHLSGFEGNFPLVKRSLEYLNLRSNQLKGSLPIPSTDSSSLLYYLASNNEFSGELPMGICNFVNLVIFDISNNILSGEIPRCLTNLVIISVLDLHNNNFSGPIPQVGQTQCNLTMIDIGNNRLVGPVPRDMENCINLEFLNLGNNKIDDVFPFWLGKLPTLRILILHSNRFHGTIGKPCSGYEFPKLHIINLSNNKFTGYLPAQYFDGWMAMKVDAHKQDQTMSYASSGIEDFGDYFYTVMVTDKGISLEYNKIPQSLTGVDLSRNHFMGEIPKSIATLKGLHFLNLSHNMLTGSIPFNLNSLVNLESLDLSHNKLSGEIPQQLTDLTTLESFDVSFNQLVGRIPQSKQFDTFENNSYQGNPGLCGPPLLKKCGDIIEASPPSPLEKDHASRTWIEIDWKIVSMGYTSGFVIGVVMGMNWTQGCKRVKRVRHIKFILD